MTDPRPTTTRPISETVRAEVTGWTSPELARVICAKTRRSDYPSEAWVRWIAWQIARCNRVVGVRPRTHLAHELRRLARIDTPRAPASGLSRDDVAHVERVAESILPTAPF